MIDNLDPAEYDAEPHPETFGIRHDRDRGELALLTAALERDMPVLGICRGIQVLNVARNPCTVKSYPSRRSGIRNAYWRAAGPDIGQERQ